MIYMGSKARIAKDILPIILKDRKEGQCYVEPFVGGGNLIDKVNGYRIGADVDKDVIQALTIIRDTVEILPKSNIEFTEEDYKAMKKMKQHPLYGYIAYAFSFGGKKWGGYSKNKKQDDYVARAYRSAIKQHTTLAGVLLYVGTYNSLYIPKNSIIYCDPPYADTTKYKTNFNHKEFWQWCRDKVKEGHKVFISEYKAPDDFFCVWSKEIVNKLGKNNSKKAIEKLFVHKSQYENSNS